MYSWCKTFRFSSKRNCAYEEMYSLLLIGNALVTGAAFLPSCAVGELFVDSKENAGWVILSVPPVIP